jgi:hypothetical protein
MCPGHPNWDEFFSQLYAAVLFDERCSIGHNCVGGDRYPKTRQILTGFPADVEATLDFFQRQSQLARVGRCDCAIIRIVKERECDASNDL